MAVPLRKPRVHPVTAYAGDVVRGKVVAGQAVRWACQRHLDDLDNGHKRGLWFDEESADAFLEFLPMVPLVEGTGFGPFEPQPWQEFVFGSTFGWMRDDHRRFRYVWVRVARGNGKSPMGAAIGLYCTGFEGEERSQVFCVATKRQQAKIIHDVAMLMVGRSPALAEVLRLPTKDRITDPETGSFFIPLGKDSKTEDGWNPYCAIFDEVHAYADPGRWHVMDSAMVKRSQHLIAAFTTAGEGAATFARLMDRRWLGYLDPKNKADNDDVFAYIAELDEGDDPYDEAKWIKANPNLGVSVSLDSLRSRARMAKTDPGFEVDFLVKNLNQWVQSSEKWFSSEGWDNGETSLSPKEFRESLHGRQCFAGLDLSAKEDLTAFVLFFPPLDRRPAACLPFFWIPGNSDALKRRIIKDQVPYDQWVKDGWIEAIQSERIDQEVIHSRINSLAREFRFARNPFSVDPKYTEWLGPKLRQEGFNLYHFQQSSFNQWTGPSRYVHGMVLSGGLEHDGNPVMRWCIGNATPKRGEQEDIMPSKLKSRERIDGAVALIMAASRSLESPTAAPAPIVHHTLPKSRGGGKRAIFGLFK